MRMIVVMKMMTRLDVMLLSLVVFSIHAFDESSGATTLSGFTLDQSQSSLQLTFSAAVQPPTLDYRRIVLQSSSSMPMETLILHDVPVIVSGGSGVVSIVFSQDDSNRLHLLSQIGTS